MVIKWLGRQRAWPPKHRNIVCDTNRIRSYRVIANGENTKTCATKYDVQMNVNGKYDGEKGHNNFRTVLLRYSLVVGGFYDIFHTK